MSLCLRNREADPRGFLVSGRHEQTKPRRSLFEPGVSLGAVVKQKETAFTLGGTALEGEDMVLPDIEVQSNIKGS